MGWDSGGWHVTKHCSSWPPPVPHPSVAGWRVNHNVLPLVLTLLNFGLCHGCFTVLCIFYSYLRWHIKLKHAYYLVQYQMMMMRDSHHLGPSGLPHNPGLTSLIASYLYQFHHCTVCLSIFKVPFAVRFGRTGKGSTHQHVVASRSTVLVCSYTPTSHLVRSIFVQKY